MRITKSISTKIIVPVVALLLLSNSIICTVSISISRSAIRRSIQQRMLDIANCASGSVDGEILSKLTAEDQNTPEYKEVLDALDVFQDNVELEYVYGIKDEGNDIFTFTVDPAPEDPAEFGEKVKYTEALHNASLGQASVDETAYEDAWGWFYSAYSPVFDKTGNVAGIIGVDFSVEWFESQLLTQTRSMVLSYLVVFVFTLIFTIIMAFVFVKSIIDPLKRMTVIAKQYEEEDFSQKIAVNSDDEVGELSNTLQSMATSLQEQLALLSKEAREDRLTGLLNKAVSEEELEKACGESEGVLLVIDLDSFKLVNDLYGHDAGDRILVFFAEILKHHFRVQDIVGRIGGDEFAVFMRHMSDKDAILRSMERLNEQFSAAAEEVLNEKLSIPLGVSAGVVFTHPEDDYPILFDKADQALRYIKQNGKHGCHIWQEKEGEAVSSSQNRNIMKLNMILNERNVGSHALWMSREAFGRVYRYMLRYIKRYHERAYKLLVTAEPANSEMQLSEFSELMRRMGESFQGTLRNSDIMMQCSPNQFFLLLPMVSAADIQKVIDRMMSEWEKAEEHKLLKITWETEALSAEPGGKAEIRRNEKPCIIIVDDDEEELSSAENILGEAGMQVETLAGGEELLEYIDDPANPRPDMILMNILMEEMDGFETMKKLRYSERTGEMIPVIFITSSENEELEGRGLSMGAMDFIRKPFEPEVLSVRVRHAIDLVRLQYDLSREVMKKSDENEQLFMQVMKSLASAIDAKDTYTKGHSGRVAEYAEEIAKRFGYSEKAQKDIYMMGLLHDVGKIGVPDEVINKPSRLTDEEFALIKTHPVIGARILENIKKMPKLAEAARYHHERYSGGGYPDGIAGESIPEEARIIAVADAYDAMTSNRSYRDVLPQELVRSEIAKGRDIQFDPVFADIMLSMIDEDEDYNMREK